MAVYPAAVYSQTNVDGTTTLAGDDHAARHNAVGTEIVGIETTLGTNSGTSVLKNFTAGDFPARINSSNVLQQALTGTITATSGTFGTVQITGGTVGTALTVGGTVNTVVMGTPNITGGTSTATKFIGHFGAIATATDAGTVTFDLALGNIQEVILGGNRTLAVSNAVTGQPFMLRLVQDATGTRTVTWFDTIKWPYNTAPTLTTTADKTDVFGFLATSGTTFDGYIVGQEL